MKLSWRLRSCELIPRGASDEIRPLPNLAQISNSSFQLIEADATRADFVAHSLASGPYLELLGSREGNLSELLDIVWLDLSC